MKRFGVWLVLALGFAAPALATFNPIEYSNLTYSTVSGQTLDLFEPSKLNALTPYRPAIVFIHGGGWIEGEKEDFDGVANYYASLGFVTVTINYRLTTVAPWPACIDDCQGAVRWLRKYASTLKVDVNHIAAYGSSAGGHLVNYMVSRDTLDDFDPDLSGYSSRVQCGVDYLGPSDFTKPSIWSPDIWALIEDLIGVPFQGNLSAYLSASPFFWVSKKTSPLIIFASQSDPVVPISQSREMNSVCVQRGAAVEYHEFPGEGHGLSNDEYLQCLAFERVFLKTWLGV